MTYQALTTRDHAPSEEHHPLTRTIILRSTRHLRHASRVRAVVATIADLVLLEVDADQRDAVQRWVTSGPLAVPGHNEWTTPPAAEMSWADQLYAVLTATSQCNPAVSLTREQLEAQIRTVAALELGGIGGDGGYAGEATARMTWAQGLGAGRHHARDGAAWDAAIRQVASERVTPADLRPVIGGIPVGDWTWFVAYAMRRIASVGGYDADHATEWAETAEVIAWAAEERGSSHCRDMLVRVGHYPGTPAQTLRDAWATAFPVMDQAPDHDLIAIAQQAVDDSELSCEGAS
jgi:hypothetical protein